MKRWLPLLTASVLAAAEPPNIVVVYCDDLRFDTLGVTGHPYAQTPHIDRIAREGALFRNAFTAAPLCSPSRASLLTGTPPAVHGIVGNSSDDRRRLATYAVPLQQRGYVTGFLGKWHMGNDPGQRPGYDVWQVMPGQGRYVDPQFQVNGALKTFTGFNADVLAEEGNRFIRTQAAAGKPFLLQLAHKAVHAPISWPKRHDRLYAEHEKAGSAGTQVKQLRCLKAVDDAVGSLFQTLTETGQLDRTLIVFASDSGFNWGEPHPRPDDDKRGPYDHMTRIPLLMRLPGLIPAGTQVEALVSSLDVAPTLLDLAGAPPDAAHAGRSLRPLLTGAPPADWRSDLLLEYAWDSQFPELIPWRAVRSTRWLFADYAGNGSDLLFDLAADPAQRTNVLDAQPAVAAELRQRLAALYAASASGAANRAPTVSALPPEAAVSGVSLRLLARANDPDDGVARIEYLIDGVVVGHSFKEPHNAIWTPPDAGTVQFTARATDRRGRSTVSAPLPIAVSSP